MPTNTEPAGAENKLRFADHPGQTDSCLLEFAFFTGGRCRAGHPYFYQL